MLGIVTVGNLPRAFAFLLCSKRDGSAVFVAARNHENIVSHHPVEPPEYVGGQEAAGERAQMERAVRVWPGGTDEYAFFHVLVSKTQI